MSAGDGSCPFCPERGLSSCGNSEVVCGDTLWGLCIYMVCLPPLHVEMLLCFPLQTSWRFSRVSARHLLARTGCAVLPWAAPDAFTALPDGHLASSALCVPAVGLDL